MKTSPRFNRDFKWYLSMRHIFNFDGKIPEIIHADRNGISGKQAFLAYDSRGVLLATKHPNILRTLLKVKGSVNLHIKMYAEDRASGLLPLKEFEIICEEFKAPEWFKEAVERQKVKYL